MTVATPTKVNGTATVDAFPVDSFRDAAQHLRRPFTINAVKFKVQSTWDTGGLIVAYMDARLVVDRLNLVCPDLWFDEYQVLESKLLMCRLTIDGISRRDVGEGAGKALYSDAFKRAAVKFGIGVSLYAVPKIILDTGRGLKPSKRDKLELTDEGTSRCRERYEKWLDEDGAKFGEPLDHGDAENAQGDFEAEAAAAAAEAAEQPATAPSDRFLTDEEQAKVVQAFQDAGMGLTGMQTFLNSIGEGQSERMTVATAFALRSMLDEHLAKKAATA